MEDEEYTPVEPKYYNYNIKKKILSELPNRLDEYKNVHICAYTVNNAGAEPFMTFLLTKLMDEKLTFPIVPVFANLDTQEFINYTKVCLFGLLMLPDFEIFNYAIVFNGFFEFDNNLYVYIDITKCNIIVNEQYRNNKLWFALLDEILNHKHLCNIAIDNSVTKFFLINEEFCFLFDEKDNAYEIPVVGYVGKHEKLLSYTYIFGESKSNKNSILGPYYYFTDFYNAFKDGAWTKSGKPEYLYNILLTDNDEGRYIKGGVVRFALITGAVKYIENYPNDDIDDSDIKKQRLEDTSLDQNYERLTMRISDHDGKWAQQFDSAYIGHIELDDDSFLKNNQILAIREYNQQVPLSYHYINKSTINYPKEEYSIL